jgi:Nitrile hydratase beta subunit
MRKIPDAETAMLPPPKPPAFKPPQAPAASTPPRKNELREGAEGRTVHDVGGLDFGPVDRHEHDLALWEKRVDAMLILMVGRKTQAYTLDAHRRVVEDYGEQQYDATTYYEKWARAIRNAMVEQDIATSAEIEAKMADVAKRMLAAGRPVAGLAIPWEVHHHGAQAKAAAKAKPKGKVRP